MTLGRLPFEVVLMVCESILLALGCDFFPVFIFLLWSVDVKKFTLERTKNLN